MEVQMEKNLYPETALKLRNAQTFQEELGASSFLEKPQRLPFELPTLL
jgi:hypothetical protein